MCFKKLLSLIGLKEKIIPPEEAWKNDYLNYKQLEDRFSTIVKTINNSFTIISLEGYSGWGKTFFLKEWTKALKQQNEIAAYYSAWDINALDQPLASFLDFLFEDLFASYKIRKSAISQFKSINQELFSLNTLGKLISKSPLAMFSVLLDATKEADRKDIGSVLRDLHGLKKRQEHIKDFRTQITKIVNKIRNGKNIYVMIDDLDICRHKFIVDFLESIKYMLDIEGLVFIVAISRDRSNVHKAINTIFGSSFDLTFFTDLSLYLPQQSTQAFTKQLFKIVKLPKKSGGPIIDSFIFYSESLSLSLKVIECCIKEIELCFLSYTKEEIPNPSLFSFLIILQLINNDIYEELGSSYQKAIERIEDKYKPAILNHQDGQREWEKLKGVIFVDEGQKAVREIKSLLL